MLKKRTSPLQSSWLLRTTWQCLSKTATTIRVVEEEVKVEEEEAKEVANKVKPSNSSKEGNRIKTRLVC